MCVFRALFSEENNTIWGQAGSSSHSAALGLGPRCPFHPCSVSLWWPNLHFQCWDLTPKGDVFFRKYQVSHAKTSFLEHPFEAAPFPVVFYSLCDGDGEETKAGCSGWAHAILSQGRA